MGGGGNPLATRLQSCCDETQQLCAGERFLNELIVRRKFCRIAQRCVRVARNEDHGQLRVVDAMGGRQRDPAVAGHDHISGQQIVEVVRDTTSEASNGFQSLPFTGQLFILGAALCISARSLQDSVLLCGERLLDQKQHVEGDGRRHEHAQRPVFT